MKELLMMLIVLSLTYSHNISGCEDEKECEDCKCCDWNHGGGECTDCTCCPAGCCPEENWYCCPDWYCAATPADCAFQDRRMKLIKLAKS